MGTERLLALPPLGMVIPSTEEEEEVEVGKDEIGLVKDPLRD